jgi:hypothetical protein
LPARPLAPRARERERKKERERFAVVLAVPAVVPYARITTRGAPRSRSSTLAFIASSDWPSGRRRCPTVVSDISHVCHGECGSSTPHYGCRATAVVVAATVHLIVRPRCRPSLVRAAEGSRRRVSSRGCETVLVRGDLIVNPIVRCPRRTRTRGRERERER